MRLYSDMILVDFHAFLRVGVYTTKEDCQSHAIQRENIKFSAQNGKLRDCCDLRDFITRY